MKLDFKLQQRFSTEIQAICQPIFNLFKVTYFSQTRAYSGGRFTHLMTNPEIIEYFLDKNYPISFTNGQGYILKEGFYIANHMAANLHSKEKLAQLRERFNIGQIIYVIEKHKEYEDLYLLGTLPQNEQIINHYINNLNFIKQFLLFYKENSIFLLNKTPLVQYKKEHLMVNDHNLLTPFDTLDTNNFLKETEIRKLELTGKLGNTRLSKQESECFKYLLRNYTQKEIAKAMILSPRTVETYINNLKNKLGYSTQRELILFGEKLGLRNLVF